MSTFAVVLLWVGTLAVLVPMVVFVVECAAALLPDRRIALATIAEPPRVAILIPAHDEAAGIAATVDALLPHLHQRDRLVVVADNCTDNTAAIAEALGVIVVVRQDPTRLGKGYALDAGVRFLEADPPDIVIVIDADGTISPGGIDQLAQFAAASARPVQSVYLLERPLGQSPAALISWLAFLVKNLVRPRGLDRLGFPCLLTGSGMAFPWAVLRNAPIATGQTAEDLRLTVDVAIAGSPPQFCQRARVMSRFPRRAAAARQQRTRWEHGHLETFLTQAPRLFSRAVRQQRLDLLALGLELSVPPLSLVCLVWTAGFMGTVLAGVVGLAWTPAILLAAGGLLTLMSIVGVWAVFARREISFLALLSAPIYLLSKLPLYLGFLIRRQTASTRTERD